MWKRVLGMMERIFFVFPSLSVENLFGLELHRNMKRISHRLHPIRCYNTTGCRARLLRPSRADLFR